MKFFYSGGGAILPEEVLPVAISEDEDTGGADLMLSFYDLYRAKKEIIAPRFEAMLESRAKFPKTASRGIQEDLS